MLTRTFQVIRGVGSSRERDLWREGITTWDQFPVDDSRIALSAARDPAARADLEQAAHALASRDLGTLARLVPAREHWRLYATFRDEACFFDIEADGGATMLPTVVGLFHRGQMEVFVEGRNMGALPAALMAHRLWVTFNGTLFDLPVLRRHFPELTKPALHLDLRFVSRRAGLTGGLKALEGQLGFQRPPHLLGVDGRDAVRLWSAWREARDPGALRALVEYNLYDAIQLRALADRLWNLHVERLLPLGVVEPPLTVFDRAEILYDLTQALERTCPGGGSGSEADGGG